ncbi:MAG: hypothetical protein ACOCX8_03880 [Bacteroidota bacterium]
MKIRIFAALAFLASAMAFQSCEDSDLLDVNETFTYEHEMMVFTTDTTYTEIDTINLAEHSSVIDQYGDKIKNIEIEEVKYWLTAFAGDDDQKIMESSLKVAAPDGSGEETISSIENVVLATLLNKETELPVNETGLDRMETLIKDPPHTFRLNYNTSANKGPLSFTVKFRFKIKMTANPLN